MKEPADTLIRGPVDDPRRPLVLYVHGGGWVFTGSKWVRHPSAGRWAHAHAAVWSTDYQATFTGPGNAPQNPTTARVAPDNR